MLDPTPEQLYQHFLDGEAGATPERLAYLDRGIDSSPYKNDIPQYPARLQGDPAPGTPAGDPYPKVGERPAIDMHGLDFLHSDIKEACVCIGTVDSGTVKARWLGRGPLDNVQMWSASKIIPILRAVSKANAADAGSEVGSMAVRDPSGHRDPRSLADVVEDIVSYRNGVDRSNASALMLKQFDTPDAMEQWVRQVTHNDADSFEFRGGYGSPPYVRRPELVDASQGNVVLEASGEDHGGNNTISAYDLCRFISMVGWHNHLPSDARLPDVRWGSLQTIVQGLGTDTARYADVALDALGLADKIANPVIVSKLGFGYSNSRHQTEAVYVAFIQFEDRRRGTPRLDSMAIVLRATHPPASHSREYMELDARMAASVAEIIQRAVNGLLA